MKKKGFTIMMPLIGVLIMTLALLGTSAYGDTSGTTVVFGPDKISSGMEEESPDIAVDSQGNAHIVWSGYDGENLFYKMMDRDGTVLIGETNLNRCEGCNESSHVRRPAIAVDNSDAVHIIFHGFSLYTDFQPETGLYWSSSSGVTESEVIYTKINPYLDDRSGDSAGPGIVLIPETIISPNDGEKSRAPNIAFDPANNRLNIVWWDGNDNNDLCLGYNITDISGVSLIPSGTTITSGADVDIDWGEPEITVDRKGGAHIVYSTDTVSGTTTTEREIFYTMVTGYVTPSGGTVVTLIDDSRITANDGEPSVRPRVDADSQGRVHVTWHTTISGTTSEIFYSMLDPGLAPQDGNPVDSAVISGITEMMITEANGLKSNQKDIFVDAHDQIHVVYADGEEWPPPARDIYHMQFVSAVTPGQIDVLQPAFRITSGVTDLIPSIWYESSTRDPVVAVFGDRAYVAYNVHDDRMAAGTWDIHLAGLQVPLQEPTFNASGDWNIRIIDQTTNCPEGLDQNLNAKINQQGNDVTMVIDGDTFTGTVSGNNYTLTGKFTDPVTGEIEVYKIRFTLTTNGMGGGVVDWVVTDVDGNPVCEGTAEFDWQREEGEDYIPGSSGGCFISTLLN